MKLRATVVLSQPEPILNLDHALAMDLLPHPALCANGCGNGAWCATCRDEIRGEALHWLRELNVVRPRDADGLTWGYAWSRDLLLSLG